MTSLKAAKPAKLKKQKIIFVCDPEEHQRIKKNAALWAAGNMSVWLRYAALNMVPPKKDLE